MPELLDAASATSTYRLRVRFCETDLMAIVHHANYLVYCEAARVDWLHKRGVSYAEWERMGIHLPVVDVRLRYRQPARFEDVLEIDTTVAELSRASVRFSYRIRRGAEVLCEAETLLACVGHDLGLRRLPPDVAAVLRSAESVSLASAV
ncbi:MAG: acyl-CoA thioesterase [Deltaproteobacteria bacterium]|nr:acyl-CoA thioesterase [Deltaproteobacteria bacterium]